jgi:serpin B
MNIDVVSDIKEAVDGNADFAFDLYGKLKDDPKAIAPKGNLFFSPYSISTLLSMVYAGARGETENQMAKALHFTLPGERLHPAFGSLRKQLIQDEEYSGYQLFLANNLWGQKGEPFLKEFLDLNKNYYGAGFSQLDFINETEKSRQIINSWIEEKTKAEIRDLIPPGGVKPETVLVLTNAIYFKDEWKTKFEKKNTRRSEFYISAEETVEIDMMFIHSDFKCYEDEKMRVIELPYKGDELSMVAFLPRGIEVKEIEDSLTAESINVLLSKMWTIEASVLFPKFKIVWGTFALNNILNVLGMCDAFEPLKADFSGINGKRNLWISDIFHQACIEVSEEGTEATAATAAWNTLGGSHFEFYANHPFIFIIKDNRTRSILFMGRVMNPAE